MKNARDVNDDHRDGFQSWAYDSSVPFAGTLQGIGCFDGICESWLVENSVVVTETAGS